MAWGFNPCSPLAASQSDEFKMQTILTRAADEIRQMLPRLVALRPELERLGEAMVECWSHRGKVLVAGNGGSAADAMHLAEELVARFQKNRRGLAAIALTDPTVLSCAANDFGYDRVFDRQIEALGNPGDVLIVLTTSGNSPNLLRAIDAAKEIGLTTAAFLGRDGGAAKGQCDVELLVPAATAHRVQEGHKILFHALCEWVDERFD